jgi:hypothetical protein
VQRAGERPQDAEGVKPYWHAWLWKRPAFTGLCSTVAEQLQMSEAEHAAWGRAAGYFATGDDQMIVTASLAFTATQV